MTDAGPLDLVDDEDGDVEDQIDQRTTPKYVCVGEIDPRQRSQEGNDAPLRRHRDQGRGSSPGALTRRRYQHRRPQDGTVPAGIAIVSVETQSFRS
jgi:hypothetical protein